MEARYAQALLAMVEAGTTPHEAVAKLSAVLKAKGKESLLPRIAHAVQIFGAKAQKAQAILEVADQAQAKHAAHASGVAHARIVENKTLIGGWRVFDGSTLKDATFKRHLKNIYSHVIA